MFKAYSNPLKNFNVLQVKEINSIICALVEKKANGDKGNGYDLLTKNILPKAETDIDFLELVKEFINTGCFDKLMTISEQTVDCANIDNIESINAIGSASVSSLNTFPNQTPSHVPSFELGLANARFIQIGAIWYGVTIYDRINELLIYENEETGEEFQSTLSELKEDEDSINLLSTKKLIVI